MKETAKDVAYVLLLLWFFVGTYYVMGDEIIARMQKLLVDNVEWSPGEEWLKAVYWIASSMVSGLVPYHFRLKRLIARYTPEKIEELIEDWKLMLEDFKIQLKNMERQMQDFNLELSDVKYTCDTILRDYPELKASVRNRRTGLEGEG